MKTITNEKMRNIIRDRLTVLKRHKALVKYIPLRSIQCHHSVITVDETVKELNEKHINRKQAESFLCNEENVMMVCNECHRKLHKK